MATYRQLRRKQDVPVVHRETDDGETIYGHTPDGGTGDSYTLRDREARSLPPEADPTVPRHASNENITTEEAMLENNGTSSLAVANAQMSGESLDKLAYGSNVTPPQLPPYVQMNKTETGTTYTFVTPKRGVLAGFEPSVPLGEDDGSGTGMAAITQRARELAGQMEQMIQQQDAAIRAENINTPEGRRGHEGTQDMVPAQVAAVAGVNATDAEIHAEEELRQQELAYNEIAHGTEPNATEFDLAHEDPAASLDEQFFQSSVKPAQDPVVESEGLEDRVVPSDAPVHITRAEESARENWSPEQLALERARREAEAARDESPEAPAPK